MGMNAQNYLNRIVKILESTEGDIESILDELWKEAVEVGRQEVLDDPKKFELGNCDDCEERRQSDEPPHNEGQD